MATIVDGYRRIKDELMKEAMGGAMTPEDLLQFQELMYRTNILETCMCLCKSAPVTLDVGVMGYHYKITDAYLMCLLKERCIGEPADEKKKAQRATALENLRQVIQDRRKRFSSFKAENQEQYKKEITGMFNTVLPVWIQYRDCYTEI
ncbi:MAG: hypothetical protein HFI89_03580 [Lachnospiraceae bacterium]|nr:hypothetical protein [Lachnospiraceae bacterium]